MGCCVSAQANGNPYDPNQANASSRAITSSQPQLQSQQTRPSESGHSSRPRMERAPLAQHVNKPLQINVWTAPAGRHYTRKKLDKERREFFETRVTDREEIWQAIHQALEVLWAGGDPGDDDGGLSTAQVILDAAGVTLPHGDIAKGCYDNFGNHYKIPRHILSDPQNLEPNSPSDEDGEGDSIDGVRDEDKSGSEGDPDEDELQRRREEKGKAPARPQDEMVIQAKLSDRAENHPLKLTINKTDSVRQINKKVFDASKLEPHKKLKMIYLGRELNVNQTLQQNGWREGDIVQGFVSNSF